MEVNQFLYRGKSEGRLDNNDILSRWRDHYPEFQQQESGSVESEVTQSESCPMAQESIIARILAVTRRTYRSAFECLAGKHMVLGNWQENGLR